MKPISRVVAKALLFDQNDRLLLIRRSETDSRRPLEWDVPGGQVDDSEDFIAAAARETKEETGIDVKVDDMGLVYTTCDFVPDHGNINWLFFMGKVDNKPAKLSSEHVDFAWMTLDDAISALEYPRQRKVLQYIKQHKII